MCKWYKEMECYIVVPTQPAGKFTTDKIAERALLEQSFRNYAAVFDKVKIVITKSQAKEHYLNFPHICQSDEYVTKVDLSKLLTDANSDAIFIGHTEMGDFRISLLANLLKSYNGELFMGYKSDRPHLNKLQFGIYNKALVSKCSNLQREIAIDSLDKESYKLLPLPESSDSVF